MFKNWFKKQKKILQPPETQKVEDAIEESLWEIKEEYDLPTEEIVNVVELKRRNLEHMHEMISRKEKYE